VHDCIDMSQEENRNTGQSGQSSLTILRQSVMYPISLLRSIILLTQTPCV